MDKITDLIKKNRYPLVIAAAVVLMFITNYKSGTYLLGWDNFSSELNPVLAVKQAINAGWSDFRSFGLVAGLGYATDLWHAVFVWICSLIVPANLIRYIFHSFVLLIGGLGSFYLFSYLGIEEGFSFLGSLYYLFNFGTIQIFSLPYEPFSIFFGFLPWVILYLFKSLNDFNKKNLLRFFLANLLFSGAFYVQTMFLVYGLIMVSVFFIYLVERRQDLKKTAGKIIILLLIIFAVNSYWLLTQGYFLAGSVNVVTEAKQTLLGWRVPFYQNKAHGNLTDFLSQTGFYTDFEGSHGEKMFAGWQSYLSSPSIAVIELLIVLMIIVGVLDGKNRYKKYFYAFIILDGFALLTNLPFFREINGVLRSSGFIDQILRSPFSKFVTVQSLTLGFFLILGASAIYHRLKKILLQNNFTLAVALLIIICSLPVFQGQFYSDYMKIQLPKEYRQLFNFFRSQDINKRIALFPEASVWGWYTYRWGYLGSGFLWHGIEQPIVSRSYDVWSRASENYYWEITDAVNHEDPGQFYNVLKKYNISYLLVDHSLISSSNKGLSLQLETTEKIIETMPSTSRVFHQGSVDVYELSGLTTPVIFTSSGLINIGPRTTSIQEDSAFNQFGDYITDESQPFDAYFPFLDLQTNTFDSNPGWKISEDTDSFSLSASVPSGTFIESDLMIPRQESFYIKTNSGYQQIDMPVTLLRQNNNLIVNFPKIAVQAQEITGVFDCDNGEKRDNKTNVLTGDTAEGTKITVKNSGKACFGYHFDQSPEKYSYLIKMASKNLSGPPLSFYVIDHTKQQNLLESQLSDKSSRYFILPSGAENSIGFSIDFQSFAYKNTDSVNLFRQPEVYMFPDTVIRNLYFKHLQPRKTNSSYTGRTNKITSWLYFVTVSNLDNGYLVFQQAFNPGWMTFAVQNSDFRIRNLDHKLINNWANGWRLKTDQNLVIIFWPQILEFIGLGLIFVGLIWILSSSPK